MKMTVIAASSTAGIGAAIARVVAGGPSAAVPAAGINAALVNGAATGVVTAASSLFTATGIGTVGGQAIRVATLYGRTAGAVGTGAMSAVRSGVITGAILGGVLSVGGGTTDAKTKE
ncbi:hypothetical protein COCVIDRAFT_42483 [Bipolaris victoriae FI3]|uniref:Uncharacterized protein n=1 Tax=Bipolaris victoriae (strain FI3) TaxID=930091 RepID=W7E6J7_BIPV3|nr:hypothetical protein COCVIDRAFT_42483 [Bipolaris victoriae FI3]